MLKDERIFMRKTITKAGQKLESFLNEECLRYEYCTECPYKKGECNSLYYMGYDSDRDLDLETSFDEKYAYAVEILLNL